MRKRSATSVIKKAPPKVFHPVSWNPRTQDERDEAPGQRPFDDAANAHELVEISQLSSDAFAPLY